MLISAFVPLAGAAQIGGAYNATFTAYVAAPGSLTYYGTLPKQHKTVAVPPNICSDRTSGAFWPFGSLSSLVQLSPFQTTDILIPLQLKTKFLTVIMGKPQ